MITRSLVAGGFRDFVRDELARQFLQQYDDTAGTLKTALGTLFESTKQLTDAAEPNDFLHVSCVAQYSEDDGIMTATFSLSVAENPKGLPPPAVDDVATPSQPKGKSRTPRRRKDK